MVRPKKVGLEYFPFDVDFFEDEKIVAIAGEFGLKGEIIAIKLLCAIYRNGYFILWNDMLKTKVIKSLPGISAGLLEQVLNRLVKWGFFDENLFNTVKVLTSRGIQKRYFEAVKKEPTKTLPYLLLKTESIYNGFAPKHDVNVEEEESKSNIKAPLRYNPYSLSVEEEVEILKNETAWLDSLQVLHHMNVHSLKEKLDKFLLICKCDGVTNHESISEAKRHFNNWMRISAYKEEHEDDKNRTKPTDRRRGNILRADEEKTYGGTF